MKLNFLWHVVYMGIYLSVWGYICLFVCLKLLLPLHPLSRSLSLSLFLLLCLSLSFILSFCCCLWFLFVYFLHALLTASYPSTSPLPSMPLYLASTVSSFQCSAALPPHSVTGPQLCSPASSF